MSKRTPSAGSPASPRRIPRTVSRASSSPARTVSGSPTASATFRAKASPLAASLTAAVAAILTRSAPWDRQVEAKTFRTSRVRRAALELRRPVASSPSPRRVTFWAAWTTVSPPSGERSPTKSRTVLVPRSTAAARRPDESWALTERRAPGTGQSHRPS